jgi:hypothetical protein
VSRHLAPETIDRFDELDVAERAAAVEHASACADCQARLCASDATRVFVLLSTLPVPAGALDRLSAELDRALDRLERRPSPRRAWASIAASIVLALALVGLVGDRPGAPTPTIERAAVEPSAVEPPYGRVDLLSSPGQAQVVDLRVGGTQVVMIFDKDLQL